MRGEPPAAHPPATPGLSLIDRRIKAYESQGLCRAQILEQLVAARWPIEPLKARFPEFPVAAFEPIAATSPPSSSPPKVLPAAATRSVSRDTGTAVERAVKQAVAEGISFQYVPLIQCSFPHADPKGAATFTRKNGWLELTLGTTRPDAGLPYGVPARLLTIYCTSEAVRTQSPEIYLGDSVHDFLRRLDVPITRGARGSLSVYANQLLRLIHSTVSIDEDIRDGAGRWACTFGKPCSSKKRSSGGTTATARGQGRVRTVPSATVHRSRSPPCCFIPFSSAQHRWRRTRSNNCARAQWTSTSTPGSSIACFI